jgi:hypothetical protein
MFVPSFIEDGNRFSAHFVHAITIPLFAIHRANLKEIPMRRILAKVTATLVARGSNIELQD